MADFKFACPSCGQHMVVDELWGGRQMQCPSCQCELIVPMQQQPAAVPTAPLLPPSGASPTASAPSPPSQHKGSAVQFQPRPTAAGARLQGQAQAPRAYTPPPIRRPGEGEEKKGGLKKILVLTAVVIVAGVGGYFGFIWVSNMQDKTNEKRRAVERNSDGGEMGHIANLYDVLDATEPGGRGLGGGISGSGPRTRQTTSTRQIYVPGDSDSYEHPVLAANRAMPVVPAVYTMDVATAKIPEGRVNGMISGTNFVLDTASLEKQPAAYLLRLRQGTNATPDREIRIYLHLAANEKISGHTWTISKDAKDKNQPSVAKSWKTNPKYVPLTKSYATGYAMKLEFGQIDEEVVSGKIFVVLPDPEQTVAAGVFKAETTIFEMPTPGATNAAATVTTTAAAAPAATAAAVPAMPPAAQKAPMQKRYTTKP